MLSIIVAIAQNNAIGKKNDLLWHLPEDLKRFKKITDGHTIIMGRKTFESLPKVLPNRKHIIITQNNSYPLQNEQVNICNDLNTIIAHYSHTQEEAFIIGGGKIYEQTLPYANKLYLTRIKKSFDAEVFFPAIYYDKEWQLIDRSELYWDAVSDLKFYYETYERKTS